MEATTLDLILNAIAELRDGRTDFQRVLSLLDAATEATQDDAALIKDYRRTVMNRETGPYSKLAGTLERAYTQAAAGKGKDRHVRTDGQGFEDQPICTLQRIYGEGYAYGQVGKKMEEAMRLPKDRAVAELLGAIVYLSAAIVVREEQDE